MFNFKNYKCMKKNTNRSFVLCHEVSVQLYEIERRLFSLVVDSRKKGLDSMLLKSLQGVLLVTRSCIGLLINTGRLSNLERM